jgi:hypothetical protein
MYVMFDLITGYCSVFQEWSAEGYQLWMVKRQPDHDPGGNGSLDCVVQLEFVKSALTVNPCMVCIYVISQVIVFNYSEKFFGEPVIV